MWSNKGKEQILWIYAVFKWTFVDYFNIKLFDYAKLKPSKWCRSTRPTNKNMTTARVLRGQWKNWVLYFTTWSKWVDHLVCVCCMCETLTDTEPVIVHWVSGSILEEAGNTTDWWHWKERMPDQFHPCKNNAQFTFIYVTCAQLQPRELLSL